LSAILIPAYNEAPRIAAVIRDSQRALPGAAVLVVDGGSTDDTVRIATGLGAAVIQQPGSGYADALRAGYRHLSGVDAIIQLDADGQHPPEVLPRMLQALQGANWVIGSRSGTGSPGPLSRRLGNAALSLAVWAASGQRIGDVTSGLWALDAQAMRAFASGFPEDVADANVRVMAARAGLRIAELPVMMDERDSGRSMHDGLSGVVNFQRSLRAIWREARA
jgi:glycosyltransferase involved in cell wall biosynthesis